MQDKARAPAAGLARVCTYEVMTVTDRLKFLLALGGLLSQQGGQQRISLFR
jgi:hypothetical protein